MQLISSEMCTIEIPFEERGYYGIYVRSYSVQLQYITTHTESKSVDKANSYYAYCGRGCFT